MVLYLGVKPQAPLAQPDRVFGYEPKGRGFESLTARHKETARCIAAGCFFISPPISLTHRIMCVIRVMSPFIKPIGLGYHQFRRHCISPVRSAPSEKCGRFVQTFICLLPTPLRSAAQ